MIKRLRKKFILTNMLLVALVLIIVFGALVGYNYQRLVRQSEEAMRTALKWSDDAPPPVFQFGASHEEEMEEQGEERRFTMVPVFVVLLDEDGGPAQVTGGNNVEVSDQVVAQAVAAATEESGAISGLNLRYLQDTDREGNSRIAFADMGWETDSLWPLIRSSLLVGALALGGFFVISLMLSGLALKPAEEAWEQQRRFVADASHELKTPLAILNANLSVLAENGTESVASQDQWISAMQVQITRMNGLINDMLTLAKLDHDQDAIPTRAVDFSRLTTGCLLSFEAVAYEKGVEIRSRISEHLMVNGSPERFSRLVDILLDNAVKHTPSGGIVEVVLSREKNHAVLSVRNSGEEISPDALPHVFDRFYRADSARSRETGGYGLGLAIAKSIVENAHGKISAESADNHTTFSVELPIYAEAHPGSGADA